MQKIEEEVNESIFWASCMAQQLRELAAKLGNGDLNSHGENLHNASCPLI